MEQQVQETITIEDLYKYFGILADAKEKAGEHIDTYLSIVKGTKAGHKEKQLACQFITRFFKYFPKQMPVAIDAIFDLCEDEDVNIRKSAIKDLAHISKDCLPEHLNRIADILTQLLQTDDQQEFLQVQTSLITLLKLNPKSTIDEIFNQINTAELDLVRKRAIKFLCSKLTQFFQHGQEVLFNKDIEDLILKHVKHTLNDVDAEEFTLFIRLLTSLPSMNSLIGRQDLINIIMSQSEIEKSFDPNDLERLMILLSCIQQSIQLYSKNVNSNKYVCMYITNVISIFDKMLDESLKFEILKSLADLCTHFHAGLNLTMPEIESQLQIIYDLLLNYLPKPTESDQLNDKTNEDSQNDEGKPHETKFNFSYVECLMYSFHILARYNQDFLNKNNDRLKDFRLRLQYFAKGTQNYIKELRNTLINSSLSSNSATDNEQNKIRRVALKVTTNIDALIKDLFHNPPSYKSTITLSWKSNQSLEAQNSQQAQIEKKEEEKEINKAMKRSLSNENNDEINSLKKKPERGIYHPPSGKYSSTSTSNLDNNANNNNNGKRRTYSSDNHYRLYNRNGNFRY